MRVVGGRFGGRPLKAPKGMATRPTTDRTRESLFNILAHREGVALEGARVLDLFAGSGALGIETISRGGAFCLFVETASAARGAIRENCEAMGLNGITRLHRRSATSLGTRPAGMGGPFTLAFLDPPYGQDLLPAALASLRDGDWLAAGAPVIAEQGKAEAAPEEAGFVLEDERLFGDTAIRFLRREG